MPSNTTRIAKNTLLLYSRYIIITLINLYTIRVILNKIGVEDYGIYNVVVGLVTVFRFLNPTLSSVTQRFFAFQLGKENNTGLKKIFAVALGLHIFWSFIILVFAETIGVWFLKNKLNIPITREYAAFWVYQFYLFITIIVIIRTPYESCIIVHENIDIYTTMSIVEIILKLGILYILGITSYDKLIMYIVFLFIINVVMTCTYLFYCKHQYTECGFRFVFETGLYKSFISFSGWNVLGTGASVVAYQGINILLNIFFGIIYNTACGIAFQVNNVINMFIIHLQTATNPQIIKLYAAQKTDDLYTLLFQNAKYSFCIVWLMVLPVSLQLNTLLRLWLSIDIPEYTILFCRLILLQTLISCIQQPFITAINATGKIKIINLIVGSSLLLVLPISYFFLKAGWHPFVPFVFYSGAVFIQLLCNIFFLYKNIHLPILKLLRNVFLPIFIIIVCSLPIPLILTYNFDKNVMSLVFISIISVLLTSILIFYIALSKNMRIRITNKLLHR